MRGRLDTADRLAEYVRMDLPHPIAEPTSAPSPQAMRRSHRVLWVVGLVAALAITAIAFGAYRQPELLLNMIGLRYCG
ncbi:MAG: hypothetical protein K9J80_12545 [Sulfuritalea sp.]|nr:hypothetical protein [Sulfuritalea sp.]